jgi:tetratricopeptide (TPR) repeat protein
VSVLKTGLNEVKRAQSTAGGNNHNNILSAVQPPYLSAAYNLLISTLDKLGRTEEALKCAEDWAVRGYNDALSHYTLGRLYAKENYIADAIKSLEIARQLDPSQPEIAFELADAYAKAGKKEDALKQLADTRQVIEKKLTRENNGNSNNSSGSNVNLSNLQIDTTSTQELSKFLSKYAAITAHTYLLQGQLHQNSKEFAEAEKSFATVLKIKPSAAHASFARAQCLQHLGQNQEAFSSFRDSLEKWENNARSAKNNGVVDTIAEFFERNTKAKNEIAAIGIACKSVLDKQQNELSQFNKQNKSPAKTKTNPGPSNNGESDATFNSDGDLTPNSTEQELIRMCSKYSDIKKLKL